MRVLITGICGFVGSTLARALLDSVENLQLTGLDNFIRPGSELNRRELSRLEVKLFHGDLRSQSDVDALPAADWVIDCAANPSVLAGADGRTSSRQLMEHNLIGTINMLEWCKAVKAGFIMLSTSRVYAIEPLAKLPVEAVDGAFRLPAGSSLETPELGLGKRGGSAESPSPALAGTLSPSDGERGSGLVQCAPANQSHERGLFGLPPGVSPEGISETFSTQPPISLYGASKLASEAVALEYGETFQFPVWINRCGVLAGAGQFGRADQGIFAYWINCHLRRAPLKYIGFDGQGHQVRDCLHPRDLVPLLRKQAAAGLDRSKPRIVNVAGGKNSAKSLRQLTNWCDARFGVNPVASDPRPRPFDLPWVVLDSTRAGAAWNWSPQTPAEAILEEIALHAEANPDWLAVSAPM